MRQLMSNENQSILICDDDVGIRRLVTAVLRGEDYAIREAEDVPGAIAAIDESAPDLLILDLNVPGKDGGPTVLGHVRQQPALQSTRVLMVTGSTEAREDDWGESIGADAHLLKPFDIGTLRTTVRGLMNGA